MVLCAHLFGLLNASQESLELAVVMAVTKAAHLFS
jgi:hypothetical protein